MLTEEQIIRQMTSNSDAFSFWEDEREDLYQDYLNKKQYERNTDQYRSTI